ncbi:MAG: hypothetical protein Q9175_002611 [Cornicularia normoerica]
MVCGRTLLPGLQESERLQQLLWTPSTKAEVGGKDENVSPAEDQIEELSLELYKKANTYAAERGIVIADTKSEFGIDESTTPAAVVLIDEVLKQPLLECRKNGLKAKERVEMPDDVALNSIDRYKEAYRAIVGKGWDEEAAA